MGTTKPNAVKRCPRCNGKGFVMQTTMMMGMMAQTQSVCPECGGEGGPTEIGKEFYIDSIEVET